MSNSATAHDFCWSSVVWQILVFSGASFLNNCRMPAQVTIFFRLPSRCLCPLHKRLHPVQTTKRCSVEQVTQFSCFCVKRYARPEFRLCSNQQDHIETRLDKMQNRQIKSCLSKRARQLHLLQRRHLATFFPSRWKHHEKLKLAMPM